MNKSTEILISKYLSGNATSEEKTRLQKWLEKDTSNQKEFDRVKLLWDRSKDLQIDREVDVNAAWEEFKSLSQKAQPRVFSLNRTYLKVAAGLALIACLGILVNFVLSDTTEEMPKIISLKDPVIPSPFPDEYELLIDSLLSLDDSEWVYVETEKKRYKKKSAINVVMITLTTGDSARAFQLPDNSIVFLNDHSVLVYPENFGKNNRKLQLNGEGYFEVSPDTMQFVVSCLNTITRGTSGAFNVRGFESDDMVEVLMVSGNAEFSGVGKMEYKKLDLMAGDRATYTKNEQIAKSKNQKKNYKWWQKKNLRAAFRRFIQNVKSAFGGDDN